MAIEILGYTFVGPYDSTTSLEDRSGVYAILTPTSADRYIVIDVGESSQVRTRVETHDRKRCWQRNATPSGLRYAAYYTPRLRQAGRKAIEVKIRSEYDPPCGKE